MLTLKQLKEMQPDTIFASGVGMDGQDEIRWVAVRGGIHDWAIYYGRLSQSKEEIRDYGDKLFSEEKIKRFVPCDDEAFDMYRY
jgi:ABC-type Fe3+-hydroxamate transport system substrate-binding protein